MPLSLLLAVALSQGGGLITEGHAPLGRATHPASFQFAPASGAGLPVIEDLCDALAAEVPNWATRTPSDVTVSWTATSFAQNDKVLYSSKAWICTDAGGCAAGEVPGVSSKWEQYGGNWCVGPDWLDVAGSQLDFTVYGSPATTSTTICPSGPDCTAKTALYQDISSLVRPESETATYKGSFHSDSWLACTLSLTDTDSPAITGPIRGKMVRGSVNAGTESFELYQNSGGAYASVYKQDRTIASAAAAPYTGFINSLSLDCAFYEAIADGTSKLTAFKDGTAGATTTTAPYPLAIPTSTKTYLGVYYISGAYWNLGPMFGGFQIHMPGVTTAQASTTVAAIARRVLADQPKGAVQGVPTGSVTYSRTGSMFCSRSDNVGSILPANRPCVSRGLRGGLLYEATGTNASVRSQELDNASWGTAAYGGASVPAVTGNYALAPDGTKTAERVQFRAATTPTQESLIYQLTSLAACASGACTESLFVKSLSGAATIDMCLCGGTCACTACSVNDSTWTRCTNTQSSVGSFQFIGNSGVYSGQNRAATDLLLWGAQVETGTIATSYTPTTSASAARGAVTAVLNTTVTAPYPISLAATYTPWDGSNLTAVKHVLEWYRSAVSRDALIVSGAGNTICLERGGSGCSEPIAYGVPAPKARLVWRVDAANSSTHCIDTGTGTTCSLPVAAGLTQTSGTSMLLAPHFYSGGTQAPGAFYWSQVCVDPIPLRCGF